MNSKLYKKVFPFTHHFYPLHKYTKSDGNYVKEFFNALSSKKSVKTENLLYIHIPFCLHHCLFCPFHATTNRNSEDMRKYTEAIVREMDMFSRFEYIKDMTINAIYFGGGSPSLMPIDEIKKIIDSIKKCFRITSDCEWSFEGEPITLANEELMHFLKEQNISRISYGIQTFNQELRDKLEIVAPLDDVQKCLELAKKYKFDDINVDMLYYLPGQTIEDLKTDMENINRLGFTSIDYYYLSYFGFPERVFKGMEDGSFPKRPSEYDRYCMHEYVTNSMIELGYNKVTENIFSKQNEPSEFYRLCWGGGYGEYSAETIAIGCSGRGYINGYSYANTTNPYKFIDEVMNNEIPIFKVSDRLDEEENRGIVFFPRFLKISKSKIIGTRYFDFFKKLIDDGLMVESDGYYCLTTKGTFYSPSITIDLFESKQVEISDIWLKEYESNYDNKTCR
ncbi:radical SAM protein [Ruminiclostridium herbifermentans]|uniref:Heme chaperone HemW n=2 Tax=Ruminiclostridium herbifermentans TaxID=2488810 RepID=A0A7H1VLH3_9FIRM|nr:radical SAM protein [Ruminiclostridium herbifermentans]